MKRMIDPKFTDEVVRHVRGILANCIGEEHRVDGLGDRLTEELLRQNNLLVEEEMLRSLRHCQREGIPPTKENVWQVMIYSDKYKKDVWEKTFQTILKEQTEGREIAASLIGLSNWTKTERLIMGLQNAIEAVRAFTPEVGFAKAAAALRAVNPNRIQSAGRTGYEVWEDWRSNVIEERKRNRDSGKVNNPPMPWPGLRKKLYRWKVGELGTIAAKSGYGKSTVALHLAHYWAYEVGGFDVAFVHLETDSETFQDRDVARRFFVPISAITEMTYWDNKTDRPAPFNFEDYPELVGQMNKYDQWLKSREETHGMVYDIHAPELTMAELDMMVEEYKIRAAENGRKIIFVIDYYNKLILSGFENEAAKNNEVAKMLKNMAEKNGIWMLVFAQDDIDASANRKRPFNGQGIFQNSQFFIRLVREDAKETKPMDRKNIFGQPIYWHKKGNLDSKVVFDVVKANNGDTGDDFAVWICNEYFHITA